MDILVNWLSSLEFWSWWILGLFLIILEIFAPGTFFLWLGIAAGIVGLIALVFPSLPWEYEWILFAVIAILSILVLRRFLKRHPGVESGKKLNQRGAQYIGRTFVLTEAMQNGRGKIHVDDTQWVVEGVDLEAGAKVIVTGVSGNRLTVEPTQ
tara:strand:- start:58 stop:516 length:459 start_codon:yes stop_codon:yes gene_type:complete